MNDGAWTDENVFDNIEPKSKHTFEARTKEDNNYVPGKNGSTGEFLFKKLAQNPPEKFTLTYVLNKDKATYTAVIPAVANGEYKFNDGEYTGKNVKEDCVPNTEYIAYVRFAETSVYEASESVMDTQTTPMITAETPGISTDNSSGSAQSVTSKTGDTSLPALWTILCVISGMGVVGVLLFEKRKRSSGEK